MAFLRQSRLFSIAILLAHAAACSVDRPPRPAGPAAAPSPPGARAAAPPFPDSSLSVDPPAPFPDSSLSVDLPVSPGPIASVEAAPRPRVVAALHGLAGQGRGQVCVTSPEREAGPAPATVLLHGMCNDPHLTCDWFRPGELASSWQVCPSGPVACDQGFQWAGGPGSVARRIEQSLGRARAEYPGRIAEGRAVLVGFSQGAFAAVELMRGGERGFVGLVLVGAKAVPRAADLRAAGVRRVGLAAGDLDGAAATMRRAAASLEREGLGARYLSLGRVGHVIPDATSGEIAALIEWAREAPLDP
jgi:predicted esterase